MSAETVRLRLVQMEVLPGRPPENTALMMEHIRAARADGVRLLVFPEMAVPGSLIGDECERDAFLRECEVCGEELLAASKGLVVVFGNVAVDRSRRNEDGRTRKYNALFTAADGRFEGPERGFSPYTIKSLLPNYGQFDESRHFHDLRKLAYEEGLDLADLMTPVRAGRLSLGCLLCEDAWDTDYSVSPFTLLNRSRPDLFITISASPYTFNKDLKRKRLFLDHARRLTAPVAYVNNVGIQNNGKTVFTFDGASCLYDNHGNVLPAGAPFRAGELTVDFTPGAGRHIGTPPRLTSDGIEDLYSAVTYGTRKFMDLCGVTRIVVGVSGGIDSSVAAAVYRRLVSPANLLLVSMPGPFTSPLTRTLARDLASRLDCLFAEIPVDPAVELTRMQLDHLAVGSCVGSLRETLRLEGPALENVQARDRSSRVLAAAAAAFGGVFTCNANKAETTVGYSTLYGDLAGYFANLGDLWKMEVYALAHHLNGAVYGREVIPQGVMDVKPSAELGPEQDVNQGLGDPFDYPYHDLLFKSWVEPWNRATPEDILDWLAAGELEARLGYEGNVMDRFGSAKALIRDLERWWNLYQGIAVAKRIQAPPVLALKRRSFGADHRESQMGPRYTRRYRALKKQILHAHP